MIEKEKLFEESKKEPEDDTKQFHSTDANYEFELDDRRNLGSDDCLSTEEFKSLNPFESETEPFENTYDEKQNDLDDNMDKDENSVNYEEKSCTSPFETDKTEFVTVDDTLVSNEDTLNEKGSKLQRLKTFTYQKIHLLKRR